MVALIVGPKLHGYLQGHKNWVQCVSWSPDAAMVVSGDQNGVLWLWNPKTGEPVGSCRGMVHSACRHVSCVDTFAGALSYVQLPINRCMLLGLLGRAYA